jgi:hypothetical protein
LPRVEQCLAKQLKVFAAELRVTVQINVLPSLLRKTGEKRMEKPVIATCVVIVFVVIAKLDDRPRCGGRSRSGTGKSYVERHLLDGRRAKT